MGQQVNFYLTPTDLQAAEERIRKCGDFLVLHSRSPESKPRIVPGIDFEENGQKWLFFFLVRPIDLASVIVREVPKQKYWGLDVLRSPILEFSICFFDGAQIRQGRIYFQTQYYDENRQLVAKSDSFLKWARCILGATKKTLHRDPTQGVYIGPDTKTWVEQKGGTLLKL